MEGNTTVAVDILIRTTLGGAGADFNKFFANLERQAKDWVARINKILESIKFNMPSGSGSTAGAVSGARSSRGSPLDTLKQYATADIKAMQAERIAMEKELTAQLDKQNKQQEADRVKSWKRSMTQIASDVKSNESKFKEAGRSAAQSFNSVFAGTFLAMTAQQGIVTAIHDLVGFVGDIFKKSLDFSSAVTALAQFEGSTDKARERVQELIKVANETPGLRFESAVAGQQKLEAVGFEADKATRLLSGLAKIRVLSGTSQQDFDIMITELAKFSQGGEQTGRIFRELANHMGALIPLIKQHFGSLNEATVKALGGPQKFLEALIGILDTVNPKFNETSLAVENLGDSYDRWKISLGAIIERNPDLVAAINVTTGLINKQTDAINKNDTAARQNAENWISRIARLLISVENFADKTIAVFTDAGVVIGDLINVVEAGWVDGFRALGKAFDLFFIKPLNTAIDSINTFKGILATVAGLGGLSGVGTIPNVGYFTGDPSSAGFFNEDLTIGGRTAMSRLRLDSQYGNSAYARADAVSKQRWTDFEAERQRVIASRNDPIPAWQRGDNSGNDVGGPEGKSTFSRDLQGAQKDAAIASFQSGMRTLDPALRAQIMDAAARWGIPSAIALAQIFQESRFKPNAQSSQGAFGLTQVQPATGNAALASQGIHETVTGQSLKNPSTALLAWGAEMTRLYQKYGDWNIVALAYHGGEKTANAYLRAAEGGKKMLQAFAQGNPKSFQYVQLLRARSGLGGDASDLSGLSDTLTKEQQQALDRQYVNFLTRVPDFAYSKDAQGVLKRASEAEAQRRGVAQPQTESAIRSFLGIGVQTSTLSGAPVNVGQITNRLTADESYVKSVRDRLSLETRYTELVLRERNLEGEIAQDVESYNVSLREANAQMKIDLALAQARNTEAESLLDYQKGYVEQVNETKDLEKETAVYRLQNLDAAFVYQRRANEAARERLDYEKGIADLQDKLSIQGQNDQLRIQKELLTDILDIRERETDAVIEAQKAQLEIQQQTVYSATQANSKVLQFMASQKGVTEAVADFKIGLIESGYDVIDKGLDAILPKMGRLTSVVHDLLGSFIKLALNAAFRRIFGLDAGGGSSNIISNQAGGSGAGGGFLSLLNRVFGGGGGQGSTTGSAGGTGNFGAAGGFGGFGLGGIGIGGTAPFNPNFNLFGTPSFNASPTSFSPFTGGTGELVTGSDLLGGLSGDHAVANAIGGAAGGASGHGGGVNGGVGTAQRGISQAFQNQIAGALLGGSLGVGLGGGSTTGQVLGGVGGAVAGTLLYGLATSGSVAGATTGGLFGSTAGLFGLSGAATFGIGLAIGGALLLASWLFGRSAKRKKETNSVNQLSGDAVQQIQQLIADVRSFKIDGASAVSQANDLLNQFKQQTATLTTKPAKALAQQKIATITQLIAQLQGEADKADRMQKVSQITDEKLVPTFDVGGFGSFTGYSSGPMPAVVHGNEAILRPNEIFALGGYRKLQEVGVRGVVNSPSIYERSFNTAGGTGGGNWSGKPQDVYVVGVFDPSTADDILDQVSSLGFAKKVKFVASKNIAQVVDSIETTMAGKQ